MNNEMTHGSFFVDQSGDPGIRVKMFQRAKESCQRCFAKFHSDLTGEGPDYVLGPSILLVESTY